MLLMSFRPAIAVVALQAQYGTATVWEPNSSQSPIHFRISGLPSNSSGSMECDLLQPEFIWMQPSLWSESIDCQVGIFSDSSCSQLIESASTAYDSKAFLERRVILGTAGVLDVWIPAHRQVSCFRMRLPSSLIWSLDHSKALLSIAVVEEETYHASFVSRYVQPNSRLSEIVIFRSFGPGIEANSALIAIGIVFAVLCMVHASGLVTQAGGAQGLRRSLVKADIDPNKIGVSIDGDVKAGRVSVTSAEERVSCDALKDFALGICLSLEFCLMLLYLVTHRFASESTMICTLVILLTPVVFVPHLLCMKGSAQSEHKLQDEREHPSQMRIWSKKLDTWRPRGSTIVILLMAPVFFCLCLAYHFHVMVFHMCRCTALCRRNLRRKCRCSGLANALIASLAVVSRALVSPPIYSVVMKSQSNKDAVCATFAKVLCLCGSLPVLLVIVIDMAMQPHMAAFSIGQQSQSDTGVTDSLVAFASLLLARQLILFCVTISLEATEEQDEEEELEVEEDEQEVDPQCAFDDVSVPDESEASHPDPTITESIVALLQRDPATDRIPAPSIASTSFVEQASLQPQPLAWNAPVWNTPAWNARHAAASMSPHYASCQPAAPVNMCPTSPGSSPLHQTWQEASAVPEPLLWNEQPGANATEVLLQLEAPATPVPASVDGAQVRQQEREPEPPWRTESSAENAVPAGAVNQVVLQRLSRISQHFLGAKANSGEWAESKVVEAPKSPKPSKPSKPSLLKEKKKKKKKKERPLELE
ncbi:unnamed protein product [Durusdinium trenchii]|uniref:Uncharacterized protein n=1 Tax=Durusdinium trenchii TaxID=1381693 RepID=A0ABP0J228_9DINO